MRDNGKKSKSLSLRARMMITSSILVAVSMLSVIIFDYINNNSYSEHLLVKEAQKITETITARTNDWLQNNVTVAEYIAKSMVFNDTKDFGKYNDLTIRIPVETDDELGKIAESMNQFISKV